MKKILILMSLLLALSGCLSKKIAWEDVSARYDEIYNESISEAAAYDSYSISDFKNLFAAVSEKVAAIKEGVKKGLHLWSRFHRSRKKMKRLFIPYIRATSSCSPSQPSPILWKAQKSTP